MYIKRKVYVYLTILLISVIICTNDVNAVPQITKILKTYNLFLSKNQSEFEVQDFDYETINNENEITVSEFLLVDLDHNKIPELVTIHNVAYKKFYINFYTYKKGKIISIKKTDGRKERIEAFSQAQGYYTVYACSKGHLHVIWNGGWIGCGEKVYRVKNNKLKLYLEKEEDYLYDTFSYNKNGKKITKNVYNSLTSKCKITKQSYFVKNNKKNRKKHLK